MPGGGCNIASVELQFSPPSGIPARIAQLIDAAASTIDIAMYHLTELTLASKLADAVARGVVVRCIIDFKAAYELTTLIWQMSRMGVICYTDDFHSIMHCKYAVFDGTTICTGSANWSANADGAAAEDFLVLNGGSPLASIYLANFATHLSHSIPLPR